MNAGPLPKGDTNQNPPGIGLWALLREDLRTHDGKLFEQGLHLLKSCANHAGRFPSISSRSHALARRISRCTVATEAPSALAISS